jgi:flavin reductase (DIM6/NTAB) family NADH-FMN oxidoreductase RutF
MAKNFEMFAGDTPQIVVTVVDQDGAMVSLTGGHVLWEMATQDWATNTDAVIVTKTSDTAQITLGYGQFTVHLLSADTVGLAGSSYYHEAQVTLADGTVGTPLTGTIKIKPNLIAPR